MLLVAATFDRFQPAKLELNAVVVLNMLFVVVHRLIFQLLSG